MCNFLVLQGITQKRKCTPLTQNMTKVLYESSKNNSLNHHIKMLLLIKSSIECGPVKGGEIIANIIYNKATM